MKQNVQIEQRYIRELKADSRKAFNALYRMYCARLYAFAYQYTKSREDAEEIVQDTFTKLWMYRASIRQEESLTRFLFQITKNLLINRFHSVLNSPLFEEFVTASHEAASTEKESASSRLEFEEFREMLLSAIRQLPATQQKIVHCRLFDELTPPETAQKLQLSEADRPQSILHGFEASAPVFAGQEPGVAFLLPFVCYKNINLRGV